MGYDRVREMDTVTEGGVEQVGDYEGTAARLTIKLDRLMIVSNQAFSAGFCMYH